MFFLLPAQLAEAIKGNTSLKLLDIGGNNIGPEGIKVLLEALRGNETLTTLELGYNPIGEEGAKHLADVLKYDLKVSLSRPSCESIATGNGQTAHVVVALHTEAVLHKLHILKSRCPYRG